MTNTYPIQPGSTVCILGAGQLGKMSLVAAHQLGYHTMVWAPKGDIPAMEMATHRLIAPFNDVQAFDEVCRVADVVTTEWENIPVELLLKLESRGKLVRPGSKVLAISQSRWAEKNFSWSCDIKTTPTLGIPRGSPVVSMVNVEYHLPGILKTDHLGYDGKGQWLVGTMGELQDAFSKANTDCVLEKLVDFAHEMSILVARNVNGNISTSDCVFNTHKDGILDQTHNRLHSRFMEGLPRYVYTNAYDYAVAIAKKLDLIGMVAIEFFVTKENKLLFNEIAPRPHNSFHASIEAAHTSQFEQHIRSICNLPLGDVSFHSLFEMRNLIGGGWEEWRKYLEDPNSRLHLYGKRESRPGRKMGHITRLMPLT